MKTCKYIMLFILSLGLLNSCVEDETNYDLNDDGYNLAGFTTNASTISGIADGTEYNFLLKVRVTGPTLKDLTSDITMTVAPDVAASTAIEGTHFRIDNPTVVLKKSDNYLGYVTLTMTTEGIVTPLAENPVLVLKVTSATGDPKIMNNGKPMSITMNFACYTELQGTYTLTINRVNASGVASTYTRTNEVISKIGVETYRTTYVGHWMPADLAPGTPGFTFTNSCNKLDIPEQNLADHWANIVVATNLGSYDPITGDLYMEYSVCASGACNKYKCTYVKQ